MKRLIAVTTLTLAAPATVCAEESPWSVRAYTGYSQLSDVSGSARGIDGIEGAADVTVDGGFTAGIGAGYRFTEHWSAEFAWEYRSNDSETEIGGRLRFSDGDYASNAFYLNGFYHISPVGRWQPYLGAGIGWLQEVDLDLEDARGEQSFSGDGDVGYQLFAGANYALSASWAINAELRYGSFTDLELDGEDNNRGRIDGLDYEPFTLQVGVQYRF